MIKFLCFLWSPPDLQVKVLSNSFKQSYIKLFEVSLKLGQFKVRGQLEVRGQFKVRGCINLRSLVYLIDLIDDVHQRL